MLDAPYLWHPVFVHFSLALLSVASGFYVLAAIRRRAAARRTWMTVAEWNLGIGLALGAITLAAGWLAFNTVEHDEAAHPIMQTHAVLALVSIGAYALVAWWAKWQRRTKPYPSIGLAGLALAGFGLLVATGWRGGELVYRHGLAVSLPTRSTATASPETPKEIGTGTHAAQTHSHQHQH